MLKFLGLLIVLTATFATGFYLGRHSIGELTKTLADTVTERRRYDSWARTQSARTSKPGRRQSPGDSGQIGYSGSKLWKRLQGVESSGQRFGEDETNRKSGGTDHSDQQPHSKNQGRSARTGVREKRCADSLRRNSEGSR
jgi:hypothetical protein